MRTKTYKSSHAREAAIQSLRRLGYNYFIKGRWNKLIFCVDVNFPDSLVIIDVESGKTTVSELGLINKHEKNCSHLLENIARIPQAFHVN